MIMISQPRFLPALNYVHRLDLVETVVYLDIVQYSPRDWENRNKIKTQNGTCWLTVPVVQTSRSQKIRDTRIDSTQQWQRRILNSLEHSYKRAPFFDEIFGGIIPIVQAKHELLMDLNLALMDWICGKLNISYKLVLASDLDVDGRGESLLVDICEALSYSCYVSGPLGRNYITPSYWDSRMVRPLYHEYEYPVYPQLHGDFIPWLSVVDLLMNCGDKSRSVLLGGNWRLASE